MADPKDYPVGYGKPPTSTQFKKGQSGNPRGRPKRASGQSDLDRALDERVRVTMGGKSQNFTKRALAAMRLANEAAAGKAWAIKELRSHLAGEVKRANDLSTDADDQRVIAELAKRLRSAGEGNAS